MGASRSEAISGDPLAAVENTLPDNGVCTRHGGQSMLRGSSDEDD